MRGDFLEKKIKHLEMIQNIINRLAGNSFALKGWAVTLIAGLFIVSENEVNKFYFYIAYLPICMFWGLDAYYLLQERLYRELYDEVRIKTEHEIDFSMRVPSKIDKNCMWNSFISKTEIGFYLPLTMITTFFAIAIS